MKAIVLSVLFVISVSPAFAQSLETPRTEFVISLSTAQIEIAPGETKTIQVNLLRSKGYKKSKASMGLSSALPEHITVTFEPAEGLMESSTATISAGADAKPGAYTLMLNCSMNYKSKGTMVKVIVGAQKAEVVTKMN